MPRRNDLRKILARQAHAQSVVQTLTKAYPEVSCGLNHCGAFELLVATVLSAQCTDARVNKVTPALFARYPDSASLAEAQLPELERLIYPTGFFRAKARNLVGLASTLTALHGGVVPSTLVDLTALPGVGRKTAHVVLNNIFAIASGVVVDTHVKRISYRLGLTTNTNPVLIEADLATIIPQAEWVDLSHRLIAHGRATCVAIRPRCHSCPLATLCPRCGVDRLAQTLGT